MTKVGVRKGDRELLVAKGGGVQNKTREKPATKHDTYQHEKQQVNYQRTELYKNRRPKGYQP